MSDARKVEIYKVCQELDLIIVEDDAYYYLDFGREDLLDTFTLESVPGIKSLRKSLLAMDTDGRVVRIDTISKFIAPGFRLGWVSGPEAFVDKYKLYQEMTAQFPCSIAQSMFLGLMTQWGDDGLDAHVRQVQ
jgi:DNA-binding transcriptional MocR family regulator